MGQPELKIRTMGLSDLPEVVRIQEAILQRPVRQSWIIRLKEELAQSGARCLVAEREGQVVGFVTGEIKTGAFGADQLGWLDYIGVAPKLMGQGVGRALAKALFEALVQAGAGEIHTAVRWDSGDMLSFFKSLGFDRSDFVNLRKRLP